MLTLVSFNIESASAAEAEDYEEGVTNLNNTPENSAVVGSRLLKPEIGWKRYDDSHSSIQYIGSGWSLSTSSTYYNGSRHASSSAKKDDIIQFVFSGTKVRIISNYYSGYSKDIRILIDDNEESFSLVGSTSGPIFVYEKTGLSEGMHHVEIKKNAKGSWQNDLYLDAIDVDGFLINPNEESISLDKNNIELFEGNTEKLTATVTPNSANVIWTSSDESIATVDQNGNVIAIKEGVITVTAKIENTNLSADCVVTVKKQGSTELESITMDKASLELLEGSQDKLTATVTPDTVKVIWSSSDESIATVDQNGNVTAIREGTTIITATIENTDISATSTVIVKKPISESSSAILSITLVNGITKEYDVTNAVLNNYLNWFDSAQGTSTFKFSKTISPYKKVTEYVVHDKIASFEVREY
ncbi:hypothetical protein C3943_13210 [Lysinibacillus sp. B2A1]|nr:hypothetical protein C3943_13210 [Lysinibacillus sp. B2A1]